jgi:ankyrin repeat protein
MRTLIREGTNLEESAPFGLSPLMFAAKECKPRAVRLLLRAGASVNAVAGSELPFSGDSPLHLAINAVCVRPRAVKATILHLLRAGANVEALDSDGWTPLMRAVSRPRGHVVELLLAAGANPNARNADGETALFILNRFSLASKSTKRDTEVLLTNAILHNPSEPLGNRA